MNIAFIKKISEKTPWWVKTLFSGFIRNKLITNKVFLAQYNELVYSDAMTDEEREMRQFDDLSKTLDHAYNHTAYYKKLFDDLYLHPDDIKSVSDLCKLPLLTREILADNYMRIQSDDIHNFYEVTTGGTTGKATHIMMEKDAIYKEWAFVYHYWSSYGYDYKVSKIATFRGVELGNRIFEINPLYQEIRMNLFLLNQNNIKRYVDKIYQYGADYIYGYPSVVYNFCRLSKERGISLEGRFKAVFLISENLYHFQQKMIEDTLLCPIAMFYGHSERAVFGEKYGVGYIFNSLYGVTEINQDGSLIVTGFINNKMPLIRYVVDDSVQKVGDEINSNNENYLSKDLIVTKNDKNYYMLTGHWGEDVLYGINGEEVSAASINFHDSTFDCIESYQFVQDEIGYCTLNIVLSGKKNSTLILDEISRRVSNKLGMGFKCEVKVVSAVTLTTRGKYRLIVQNCKKQY